LLLFWIPVTPHSIIFFPQPPKESIKRKGKRRKEGKKKKEKEKEKRKRK
jgi:thymidylate kinase